MRRYIAHCASLIGRSQDWSQESMDSTYATLVDQFPDNPEAAANWMDELWELEGADHRGEFDPDVTPEEEALRAELRTLLAQRWMYVPIKQEPRQTDSNGP